MARFWIYAIVAGGRCRGPRPPDREGAEPAPLLKEVERVRARFHGSFFEMKAEGTYIPESPTGGPKAKAVPMKVEGRLIFIERVDRIDPTGRPTRTYRQVRQAANAINNDLRHLGSQVRPEVSLLIAERREGGVVVFSAGGPLTRSELDLVQTTADPLALAGLLAKKAVKEGERWTVSDEAAKALTDYDALASNRLEARLEELTDDSARISLGGEVRGASRGGEGVIACKGSFRLDRKLGFITELKLERTESRKPGPVEHGLEVKSTLAVDRTAVEAPPELSEAALSCMAIDSGPQRELLLLTPPNGRYTILHDRDWHLVYDDDRQVVLKRLDHGEFIAQCNLAVGPNAGRGKHQDLEQFQADVRRALGKRFGRIYAKGEVEGPPSGGFRYKVSAEGREGDLEIVWHYFLVASPEGDQLLVTFTLGKGHEKKFADQDLQIIGSLEWRDPEAAEKGK